MNQLLLIGLMALLGEANPTRVTPLEVGTVLEIPGHLQSPRVFWRDLDGDGLTDIYLRDREGLLWVWDGRGGDNRFRQIQFPTIGGKAVPTRENAAWQASVFHEGLDMIYRDGAWSVRHDYNGDARIRPGLPRISGPDGMLLPTYDGYRIMDGACELRRFRTLPAVELSAGRLTLSYVLPRWTDMDGDGREDLLSHPVPFRNSGELRVWSALNTADGWKPRWSKLQFPDNLELERYGMGDINGDGFAELVVLARPTKDTGIFDELHFVVYMGSGHGEWENVATQTLESKQNLWQVGPVEVGPRGILMAYYKGLIKSKFKIDLYRWREAGFVDPKPDSLKWRMPDADRDEIYLNADWNGDGMNDLILQDERGIHLFPRQGAAGIGFEENRFTTLVASLSREQQRERYPEGGRLRATRSMYENVARGDGRITMVSENGQGRLWHFYMRNNGYWYLERMK